MKFKRNTLKKWANLLAILAAFFTNILANIYPINDLTIGEISNTFFQDVLITPASYAFAIWGLIYLGLISLAIYQVLPQNEKSFYVQKIDYYLVISSLAQILWVFLFLSRFFVLSTLAMLAILVPLILLYLKLEISLTPLSKQEKYLVHFPISVYFGWITVATIVNVALALYWIKWNSFGLSQTTWTVIIIIMAAVIGILVRISRKDRVYCGVLVWALIAITIRHLDRLPIAISAGLCACILGVMALLPTKSAVLSQ